MAKYRKENYAVPVKPEQIHFCWCGAEIEWELVEAHRVGPWVYFPQPFWTRGWLCSKHDKEQRDIRMEEIKNAVAPKRIFQDGLANTQYAKTFSTFNGYHGIIRTLKNFCLKRDNNILLTGPPACGKSHLLVATINELSTHRVACKYMRFTDFKNSFYEYKDDTQAAVASYIRNICKDGTIMAIDDVGANAPESDWMKEQLYDLFDQMEVYGRKGILLATNCDIDGKEFEERIGFRTVDRLRRNFTTIRIEKGGVR